MFLHLQVCPECPPPPPSLPLTTHQTRVLKSLEKINIPSWFRPVNKPVRQRQSQHTDKPQWKRSQEPTPDPTVRCNDEPMSHWLSSREPSACPSFSSAYSRLSSTRQAYRSPRDGSIQSWQAPTTRSYKEPYIGWRSHQPHQESVPYLLPPPQRLANSTARDGGAQADLLTNMGWLFDIILLFIYFHCIWSCEINVTKNKWKANSPVHEVGVSRLWLWQHSTQYTVGNKCLSVPEEKK